MGNRRAQARSNPRGLWAATRAGRTPAAVSLAALSLAALSLVLSLAVLLLGACADDGGDTGGNICDTMNTPYDAYSSGLTKIGDGGTLKVRLMSATPTPPERGDNSWTLQLVDMNNTPLPGAVVTEVTPWMPDHGHGTTVMPVIGDTSADGQVTIDELDLRMAGVWTVTFDVDNGGQTDTATFSFCIDG